MSERLAIAALVLALASPAVAAVPQVTNTPTQILVFGQGRDSCATWLSSPATKAAGDNWVLGMRSGMNTYNMRHVHGHMVGDHTDGLGVLGEIKKVCDAQPSLSLSDAALTAYDAMLDAGR